MPASSLQFGGFSLFLETSMKNSWSTAVGSKFKNGNEHSFGQYSQFFLFRCTKQSADYIVNAEAFAQLPNNCSIFSSKKVAHVTFSHLVWGTMTTYSCFLCLFQVAFSKRRKVEEGEWKGIYFVGAKRDTIWPSSLSPSQKGFAHSRADPCCSPLPSSAAWSHQHQLRGRGGGSPTTLSEHKDQHLNEWVIHETSFSAQSPISKQYFSWPNASDSIFHLCSVGLPLHSCSRTRASLTPPLHARGTVF